MVKDKLLLVAVQYGPADLPQVFVVYSAVPLHCAGGAPAHLLLDIMLVDLSVDSGCDTAAAQGVHTVLIGEIQPKRSVPTNCLADSFICYQD